MLVCKKLLAFLFLAAVCASAQEMQEARMLRFPDISRDNVAFYYGGDLWLVPTAGGVARRVTSYTGRELFPKFSPMENGWRSPGNMTATLMST